MTRSTTRARSRIAELVIAAVTLSVTSIVLPPGPVSAHVPHDHITDVVVSPTYEADGTVFAISRNHLMRSTDGGSSWAQIVRGITGLSSRLAVAPTDPNVLYMSVLNDGIFRSRDQGWSWDRTNTLAAMRKIRDVDVSPRSSDVAFATGSSGGLFRTTDGGSSWRSVGSFGAVTALSYSATGRVIVGGSDGKVFISDDDGETWTRPSGVASGEAVTAIASSDATVLIGTRGGRVFRSTDLGTAFSEVGSGLPDEQITSIAMSNEYATDPSVWVSTWDLGVYRSSDRGASFRKTSRGLTTNPQAPDYGQPQFAGVSVAAGADGQQTIFVAGYDGLFRSEDRGANWRQVQTLAEYIVGLAVSPDYRNDGTVIATTYLKGAYLSSDRGMTWAGRHVGLGLPDGQNDFAPINRLTNVQFSPDYVNDGTMFTAGHTSLLKSTDRGSSWTAMRVVPPEATQQLFVVAVSPAYATDRTVYVGSTFGTIFRSTSGGAAGTWTRLGSVGGKVRSIVLSPDFPADPVLYAGSSTAIFKSVDAGLHWVPKGPLVPSTLAISPNYRVDGTVFAGSERGLLVSRNRGSSWTKLSASPLSTSSHVEAVAVSPNYAADQTVLVSVSGKGLYRSANGGTSFTETGASLFDSNLLIGDFDNPTAAPIQFSPAFAADQTIFAMAQTHIVKSTDSGDTWQAFDLPPAARLLEPPVITPAPAPAPLEEGDTGEKVMRVAFDLSHPYASTVSVDWRTVDVPHRSDVASSASGDYTASSGRLVYPKGATRQYVDIVMKGDTRVEDDELVIIAVTKPVNARLGANLGFGIIADDDDG
jgi:photosystem II stability/assembly factor-like uncharacterized protein